MTKTIFLTTKNNSNIAKAEIETLCDCELKEIKEGIFIGEPKKTFSANRFGFVKEILILNKILNKKTYFDEITDNDILNNYKIRIVSEDKQLRTKEFSNIIYKQLSNPKVDLEKPDHEYVFLFLENKIYLLESKDKNTDRPDERKAHKKIHNHPTSLDPKLAKALINLSGKESFHDPFCGTGGLVIEGALMGLDASGSDIAPGLIVKAKENAEAYSLKIDFKYKNALNLEHTYSALITDLPYGKNSVLLQEITVLYEEFFKLAESLTNSLVVGMMETTNEQELLKNTSWRIKHQFIIYVHKSMSRKFLVLEK